MLDDLGLGRPEPPERCTHVERGSRRVESWEDGRPAYVSTDVRCSNDAHPDYTFDHGLTRLCAEHGEAREIDEAQTRGEDDGREWKGHAE